MKPIVPALGIKKSKVGYLFLRMKEAWKEKIRKRGKPIGIPPGLEKENRTSGTPRLKTEGGETDAWDSLEVTIICPHSWKKPKVRRDCSAGSSKTGDMAG